MLVPGRLGNARCFPTCLGNRGGPANIKSSPITRQIGAARDGDRVVSATWLIKCPLVPSFPLHGTIVWTYAGSDQGWADGTSLWHLCHLKDEYSETMLWCLKAWLFKESAVGASKQGAPLDPRLVWNPGFVYHLITRRHASLTQFLSCHCLGSVSAESLRVTLHTLYELLSHRHW